MTHRIVVLILTALVLASPARIGAANSSPGELKCENLREPLGVNTITPRFSWKNIGDMKRQTAYDLVVGTDSVALAERGEADLWRSGKVESDQSVLVPYGGGTIEPRVQAWWKVRTWDDRGRCSAWSPVARFGVGITEDATQPLRGAYIGMPADSKDMRTPLLRRQFEVTPGNGRVMCHVNSLGYHELYVNGKKAGANVLAPGVSQLGTRSLIVTYDITPLVQPGQNDMVLWLGQGWYKPTTFKATYPGPVAKVEVDLVEGTSSVPVVESDGDWMAAESGYNDTDTWNALRFGGERVDGRILPASMDAATLNGLRWRKAAVVDIPAQVATPEMSDQNRIMRTSEAVNVERLPDGRVMADMGRVLTGWFELALPQLPAGTEVKMEYSDHRGADGNPEMQGEADIYVSGGKAGEKFCNKFNHHAFRYVVIGGLDKMPEASQCKAHQIHGNYADASSFECSDADLNAVHDMIKYTMKCLTFSGYMVDCPHLERTGYGGDGNSSTMTLQTMYDVAPTYANWLEAWRDVIRPDGGLPHVAPAGGGGGGPYWCAFIALAPWRTWLNYADTKILEECYPAMKQWMGYVDAYTPDGLLRRWPDTDYRGWYLGDWLPPAGVDVGNPASIDLVNNCVVSECLDKMERIARRLGHDDDARLWREKRLALNARIHYAFFDHNERKYATGSQLDMAYPMLAGVTLDYLRDEVRQRMLDLSATESRGHIGVGLVGVPILTQWAVSERQPDFMADMLRHRDYPGYLYMIDNGATTTWEYWSGERSRVHNCYNGIGTWFYQALGGIVPDENSAGYKHFFVSPQIASTIDWVRAGKETPYGTAAVQWEKNNGKVECVVTVPAGATATFLTPDEFFIETDYAGEAVDNQCVLTAGTHHITLKSKKN